MSDENKTTTLTNQLIFETLEAGNEIASRLDRMLVSLSSGALIFSMTFIKDLAPHKLWLRMLFAAWINFGISIILILVATNFARRTLIAHAKKLSKQNEEMSAIPHHPMMKTLVQTPVRTVKEHKSIEVLNVLALLAFLAGLALLGVFVGRNLLAT